ncbi:MAG: ABC transporter permease subunit [Spirochaetales bacterium]|uniref:ABC transporter permease subunit n=1 Tax=Candidatus Thalassospirochaeta sargassi TaxID=3119039 RepID=A0AAJ1MKH5_9SPIO|nr:ABC transporter permease subunit [Spirochaetales bacterium]
MNIFIYEMKTYQNSIIIWSLSISALMLLFMAIYPTFAEDAALMESILSNFPEEFARAFGMGGNLSLTSVPGYFKFIFIYIQLAISIQSSNYGFHFLSVDERELTADFIMSKPVSRRKLVISKFSAAFSGLIITNTITTAAGLISIELFRNGNSYDAGNILVLMSSTFFFQLFFLSAGMLVSVSVKKIRSVLAYSMGLAFGMYIISALKEALGMKALGYISPFYHFEPGYMIEFGKYNMERASISFAFIIVSIVVSWNLYMKRDIHSL